jgi:putative ABC transport system permease protein
MSGGMSGGMGGNNMGMSMDSYSIWTEILSGSDGKLHNDLLDSQYDLIAGRWAQNYNELVLVTNQNNELSDYVLYALGLLDRNELDELISSAMKGEEIKSSDTQRSFTYDEILSLSYKLLLNTDYYAHNGEHWEDMRGDEDFMKGAVKNAIDLNIVGILRPSPDAAATAIEGAVGYTSALTQYLINAIPRTDIAEEQLKDPETNVFTGVPFDTEDFADNMTMDDVYAMIAEMPEDEQAQTQAMLGMMSEDQIIAAFAEQVRANADAATYEDNIALLGIVDFETPSAIRLYPKDFDAKEEITTYIADYNQMQENAGQEENVIHYTDIVGLMTSSISDMIGIVSYVLIAFVAISLVVSSIMIAIITYISVLERTKEIGILRSIGASKKDITRVFNAETFIEGFVAGALGVGITILLNYPINALIEKLAGVSNIAKLPLYGIVGLIIISVILTLIAGFIPSKMAAKKDPVEALRTE